MKYEDVRISGEDWGKLKPTTPTGSLPMLEVDGKALGGSIPLARFLAERFDLAGSNDVENAEIAGVVDMMVDLFGKFIDVMFEKDEDRKAELQKKLNEDTLPSTLSRLEKKITTNGWFCVANVTYADLYFQNLAFGIPAEALSKFPGLVALKGKVESLPNIAKWLKDRPETAF